MFEELFEGCLVLPFTFLRYGIIRDIFHDNSLPNGTISALDFGIRWWCVVKSWNNGERFSAAIMFD
jgi:hypothetical protein